jgi:hypothetical protein
MGVEQQVEQQVFPTTSQSIVNLHSWYVSNILLIFFVVGGSGRGCTRTPVGTHPHLLVVGASNPTAVPIMARWVARWCEPAATIRTIGNSRETPCTEGF